MINENKAILQEVVQMYLDGTLDSLTDVFSIIDKYFPGDNIPSNAVNELTELLKELVGCHTIPEVKAYAEKYQLTIC